MEDEELDFLKICHMLRRNGGWVKKRVATKSLVKIVMKRKASKGMRAITIGNLNLVKIRNSTGMTKAKTRNLSNLVEFKRRGLVVGSEKIKISVFLIIKKKIVLNFFEFFFNA